MKLSGKVAVVTGGGQGIGRAISLALTKNGADIAIYDINIDKSKSVADEIKTTGQRVIAIKCDVSDRQMVSKATEQVLNEFNQIDILVNNAGIGQPIPAIDITEAALNRIIDVNFKGVFFCCQLIGRQMMKQKYGKIINITSVQAHAGMPLMAAYAASKGAVLSLTRTLAVEWASYGIRVNTVSPGMTKTPRVEVSKELPGFNEDRVARIPLKKILDPEDVANTVLYLASPESDFVTGQSIIVDGGVTALHSATILPK